MGRNEGTYGQVYDRFWDDPEVLEEWSMELRLFWLYLLTGPQRNILGVFEFSERLASLHTGLAVTQVQECTKTLVRLCKVSVSDETRELCVHNWLTYRGGNIWTNPNIIKGLENCAGKVKDKKLLSKLIGSERVIDAKSLPEQEIEYINETEQEVETDSNKTLGTVLQDSDKTDARHQPTPLTPYTPYKHKEIQETPKAVAVATIEAELGIDAGQIVKATKPLDSPTKRKPKPGDTALYQSINQAFLSRNGGKFTDYAKEGAAIKGIIAKCEARQPGDPAGLAQAMIAKLWELKSSGRDKFYQAQPFTPSALNSAGIWDRVLEQYRDNSEQEAEAKRLVAMMYGGKK